MKLAKFFYEKKHTWSGKTLIKICKIPVWNKKNKNANKLFSCQQMPINYKNIKDGFIDIDSIKGIIENSEIKIVSFDIFDTLLIRPTIIPTDIFYLIDAKLKKLHNVKFLMYRLHAEEKLGNENASIDDIYSYIKRKNKISDDIINLMKKEELDCEASLLRIRDDIYNLYLYALSKGKKVIAISDMYLNKNFLKKVLEDNGYKGISEIYISNEIKKRKDSGELYKYVIKKEKVIPQSILHIGDNFDSDYLKAIQNNIVAIHYPSIKDIVFAKDSIYANLFLDKKVSPDPMCRILLGFTLNNYFKDMSKVNNQPKVFNDFKSFVDLSLAPLMFYIGQNIANNEEIQKKYEKIFFTSRDGYLPKFVYDIISKYMNTKPSEYLYAGRRAYSSCQNNNFIEYIKGISVDSNYKFNIKNLLDAYIYDENLKSVILNNLSNKELDFDFSKDKQKIINILHKNKKILNEYWNNHRKAAIEYYNNMKTKNNREIVFDCGYSGSVSEALSNVMKKPVDKIYLWQEDKNIERDKKNGTKTFLIMHEKQLFSRNNILYEELFSPLEGGVLGFSKDKTAILENVKFNKNMISEYKIIRDEVSSFTNCLCGILKNYLPYINIFDTFTIQSLLNFSITKSPFNEVKLFDNIHFPDPVFTSENISVSKKIQEVLSYCTQLDKTGFENPLNEIKRINYDVLNTNNKIGIHCHLYNTHIYEELLVYLKNFPVSFDLILTICDKEKETLLKNIFSNKTIKNLNNLIILIGENRGRDIAPWLVLTKKLQNNYDLFCHIHAKESSYSYYGRDWRKYLFDNLISRNAAIDIINIFSLNKDIGIIFPKLYDDLRKTFIFGNIPVCGVENEIDLINLLLSKMKDIKEFNRSDFFFSGGTMFWYRPKALKNLFDLNLKYKDFPKEPIGVGGTIAHAIERLPAFICNCSGFRSVTYNIKE